MKTFAKLWRLFLMQDFFFFFLEEIKESFESVAEIIDMYLEVAEIVEMQLKG